MDRVILRCEGTRRRVKSLLLYYTLCLRKGQKSG